MKISANDFWRLLPIAIERLCEHYRLTGNRHPLYMVPLLLDPDGHSHKGAVRRWVIQDRSEGRYIVDPLSTVIWLLTDRYVCVSDPARHRYIGMDRRFACRLHDATYQKPGFSRPVRKKLLDACGIEPAKQFMEPTTL